MKTIKILFFFLFMSSFSAFAGTPVYWAYWDNDLDGHASLAKIIPADKVAQYLKDGWFVVDHQPAMDCDDNNDLIFHQEKLWIDNDGDGYVNGFAVLCFGSVLPAGHIRKADVKGWSDCDDNDPTKWKLVHLWFDNDGDLRVNGTYTETCVGERPSYPAKWIPKEEVLAYGDCDDNNDKVWRKKCCYLIGAPINTPNVELCVGDLPPAGYGFCPRPAPPTIELTYSVYPNPVTDRLNITPNENWNNRVEIRLVDQFGRVARVVNNPSAVKGQAISVNTSDLKPGIYNLTIKNGELMATKQIGVKL